MIGFHPQMILAGRRINDGMAAFVANDVIKTMLKRKQSIDRARVLVMGPSPEHVHQIPDPVAAS